MEVDGQLDAAADLLSRQKDTEHETGGLLSSGVMGVCHAKHRMSGCHYRRKIHDVTVTQITVYIHYLSRTKDLKLAFSVDLEFLDIFMSSISDIMTQKWSFDSAVG
jgi:hypothetical protein